MNDIFETESDHPLFRYFTAKEREEVEALAKVFNLEAGGLLIEAAEQDSTLFAIESGHLEVIATRGDENVKVASVGPGDVLGEVSFIDASPRTVSVRAVEDATVLAWNRKTLCDALDDNHTLLAKFSIAMSELLVERLRVSVQRQGMVRPI